MEKPATPSRHKLALAAAILAVALSPTRTNAQGCTQCRDATAATTPATQRAYRRAIELMTLAGATLFIATIAIARRHR